MASVHDNWYVERTRPDGTRTRARFARYGHGKRWVVRWRDQDDAPHKRYFDRKTDAGIWKPALTAAGIPTTRANDCHALRQYYASVLLDGGESIKTVSERLGHADPGFVVGS